MATAGNRPYTFALLPGAGLPGDIVRRAGTRQLFYPYPDELRSAPPDLELLHAVAEQTGGKVGASVTEIFDPQDDRGVSRKPLWPWLAAAALVLFLLDILVRRAPWMRRLFDR